MNWRRRGLEGRRGPPGRSLCSWLHPSLCAEVQDAKARSTYRGPETMSSGGSAKMCAECGAQEQSESTQLTRRPKPSVSSSILTDPISHSHTCTLVHHARPRPPPVALCATHLPACSTSDTAGATRSPDIAPLPNNPACPLGWFRCICSNRHQTTRVSRPSRT